MEDRPNCDYKLHTYWDQRFAVEETYDWLVKFEEISPLLSRYLPSSKECKILVVGCGNSSFSSDLYDSGYEYIVNIDFSEVCIERMRDKYISKPNMSWMVMDMTNLTFPDHSFDVVIDKASMDAIMVDEGDVWDPEQETIDQVDQMCLGIRRILRPEGIFLQITFAQPHFRTKYLMAQRKLQFDSSPFESLQGYCERYDWILRFQSINPSTGCISYFVYAMTPTTRED